MSILTLFHFAQDNMLIISVNDYVNMYNLKFNDNLIQVSPDNLNFFSFARGTGIIN